MIRASSWRRHPSAVGTRPRPLAQYAVVAMGAVFTPAARAPLTSARASGPPGRPVRGARQPGRHRGAAGRATARGLGHQPGSAAGARPAGGRHGRRDRGRRPPLTQACTSPGNGSTRTARSCARPRGRSALCNDVITEPSPGRTPPSRQSRVPRAGLEQYRREVQPDDRGGDRRPLRREFGERAGHNDPDPLIRCADNGVPFTAASRIRRQHPGPAPFAANLRAGCLDASHACARGYAAQLEDARMRRQPPARLFAMTA
jgi:hypothetical protein